MRKGMVQVLTRQQLHDLVWSGQMREAAKRLGISDVALRKHCVKAFVPPPPQDHWNKAHAGQEPRISPLPPRPPGFSDEISIGRESYPIRDQSRLDEEPTPPVFSETIEALRERVMRNIGKVVAAKDLATPHIAFKQQIEDDARRKIERSTWNPPVLSTSFEQRRLRILKGLFNGLARLNCAAKTQGKDVRDITISVGHQHVKITLDRPATRNESSRAWSPKESGDLLELAILKDCHSDDVRSSWQDNASAAIESQLTEIAIEIVIAGELQYRENMQRHYEWQVKCRESRRRAERYRKLDERRAERNLEAARLKRLQECAENHRKANDIRGFVASVIAVPNGKVDGETVTRWQEWALAQADRLDPLTTGQIWEQLKDTE
jgi:hypothetical protein